jgi:hypothetical protein
MHTTDIPPLDDPSIAAILGWAGQHDGRISLEDGTGGKPGPGDVNYAKWVAGLQHVRATVDQAAAVITDYYANTPNDGQLPPITPYMLRQRLAGVREYAQAEKSAAKALPPGPKPKGTLRSKNPEEWDRIGREARDARRADLERRGIPLHPWQQTPNGPGPMATRARW